MPGENVELAELTSGLSELSRLIPTRDLLDFQRSLNTLEIQFGDNAGAVAEFSKSLKSLNADTVLSQNQIVRFSAQYATSINQISLSMANFATIARASATIDPFNTEARIAGFTRFSNKYGSLMNELFSTYDKEKHQLTDLKRAYEARELALHDHDYALAASIETMVRGGQAADDFAFKTQKLGKAFQNSTLNIAKFVTDIPLVNQAMAAASTDTGSTALTLAGILGGGYGIKRIGGKIFGAGTSKTASSSVRSLTNAQRLAGASELEIEEMTLAKTPGVMSPGWLGRFFGSTGKVLGRGLPYAGAVVGVASGASELYQGSKHLDQQRMGQAAGSLAGVPVGMALAPETFGISLIVAPMIGGFIGKWLSSVKEGTDDLAGSSAILARASESLQKGADKFPQSFAAIAINAQALVERMKVKYRSPEQEEGSKLALLQSKAAWQRTLAGTGQVPISTSIQTTRDIISQFDKQEQDLKNQLPEIIRKESVISESTYAKEFYKNNNVTHWSELKPDDLKKFRKGWNDIQQDKTLKIKGSEASSNVIQAEIFNIEKEKIEAMALVRRTYMEQFTGQAMGLNPGTYTMPSMMSDYNKFGPSYITGGSGAGYPLLTKEAIANRTHQKRYGDLWGSKYASDVSNPISGDVAHAMGVGSSGVMSDRGRHGIPGRGGDHRGSSGVMSDRGRHGIPGRGGDHRGSSGGSFGHSWSPQNNAWYMENRINTGHAFGRVIDAFTSNLHKSQGYASTVDKDDQKHKNELSQRFVRALQNIDARKVEHDLRFDKLYEDFHANKGTPINNFGANRKFSGISAKGERGFYGGVEKAEAGFHGGIDKAEAGFYKGIEKAEGNFGSGTPSIRHGTWASSGLHNEPAKDSSLKKIASLLEKANQLAAANQAAFEHGLTNAVT